MDFDLGMLYCHFFSVNKFKDPLYEDLFITFTNIYMDDIENQPDKIDTSAPTFADRVAYYANTWFKDLHMHYGYFRNYDRGVVITSTLSSIDRKTQDLDDEIRQDFETIIYRGTNIETPMPKAFANGVEENNLMFLEVLINAYGVMKGRNSKSPKFTVEEYRFLTDYILSGIVQGKQYGNLVGAVADSMNYLGSLTNINFMADVTTPERQTNEMKDAQKMMSVLSTMNAIMAVALTDPSNEYFELARNYYGQLVELVPQYLTNSSIHNSFLSGLSNIGLMTSDGSNMISYIHKIKDIATITNDRVMFEATENWIYGLKQYIDATILDSEQFLGLGIRVEEDLQTNLDEAIRVQIDTLLTKNIKKFDILDDFSGTFDENMKSVSIFIDPKTDRMSLVLKFERGEKSEKEGFTVKVGSLRNYRELMLKVDIDSSPEVLITPDILDSEILDGSLANSYKRLILNLLEKKVEDINKVKQKQQFRVQANTPVSVQPQKQKQWSSARHPVPGTNVMNYIHADTDHLPLEIVRKIERINTANAGKIGSIKIAGKELYFIRAGQYFVNLRKGGDDQYMVDSYRQLS